MRIILPTVGTAVLAALILTGCGNSGDVRKGPPRKVSDLKETDVMFVANGERYLRQDFEYDRAMRLALMLHKRPGMPEAKQRESLERIGQSVICSCISSVLVDQSVRENFVDDTNVLARCKAKYVRTFARAGEGFEDLRKSLAEGKDGARLLCAFDRTFTREYRSEAYHKRNFGERMTVTSNRLEEVAAMMAEEDRKAAETNRFIYAHATNVWIQAKAGADFGQLADLHSEEVGRREGGFLGECDRSDFEVEKLDDGSNPVWEAVNRLQPGDVSDLMSTSEGLTMFKCLARTNTSEMTGKSSITLARIAFHRALAYQKMDKAELKKTLERNLRQETQKEFFAKIHAKAKLEFPNGVEFFPGKMRRIYRKFAPPEMIPVPPTNRPPARAALPAGAVKTAEKEKAK